MRLPNHFLGYIATPLLFSSLVTSIDPRPVENLNRGVVAVRASEDSVLVTWRLLSLDDPEIGFNVYRASGDGDAERINQDILTSSTGTNFLDETVDTGVDNTYSVRVVVDGDEGDEERGTFTLQADNAIEPAIRIPVRDSGRIKYVWVGDLDGDGTFDFVVDRTQPSVDDGGSGQQSIEAYLSNGTFLWEIQLGPNSENQNNIEPGSTAISVGNWDGVTVFDFNSDGYAEVAVRLANGVVLGDGSVFEEGEDDAEQWVGIVDGLTGALKGSSKLPTDYIEHGPLAARYGVGYLDGMTPHLVVFAKNRRDDKGFNRVIGAWTFDGEAVSEAWIRLLEDSQGSDGHNTRAIDVNGDGTDDVVEIGFVLNGKDGETLYRMPDVVVHGDRYYVGKFDPEREGLQGYGIQQDNEELLMEYYYDAADGTLLWEHYGTEVGDVGRGLVGDIDPTHDGFEVWSFQGIYNGPSNETTIEDPGLAPWPQMTIWWDGDDLAELYNDGKLEKWDWENPSTSTSLPRIFRISDYGASNPVNYNPGLLGDILGDWREEVVVTNSDHTELIIFTTDQPTDRRLYTLAHNPAYRNGLTFKGYMQSHTLDYYLGSGMSTPPQPNIRYAGAD